ncbi:RagB/SusD family nutrient uptake outer membrane protein [Desertivirga brevis]|uniref:RagB/SusD family nutrient uptake outer membrane protein n=1 Tax=Desertivirga brevis TaxID=2810310 RepID=UPI001A95D032|nr:RagB/SusD family nutrient uptake outer membrane protein [Pedobacter sp. SYSU D00873]
MKTRNLKLAILLFPFLIAGCEKSDFLNDGKDTGGNEVTEEQFWNHRDWPRNFLNSAYSHLPDEYNLDGDGALLASASDEAVNSNPNSSVNWINNGSWGPGRTFNDVYADMYEGIRKTNVFLENIERAKAIVPVKEEATEELNENSYGRTIERLKGQAYFLRAFYHFELLKRYGGVPVLNRSFEASEDPNVPKNEYDEVVRQIVMDCDSAATRLPLWHGTWDAAFRGRATKAAAQALKSRTLLYAASPLNNENNSQEKWQAAAQATRDFILDAAGANSHRIHSNYSQVFTQVYNPEYIFGTRVDNRNDIEANNAPVSYNGGKGRTNPTQEMVDAFEVKVGNNSYAISDPASGYTDQNLTLNRDPRLALSVIINGSSWKGTPLVETFVGGKDGLNGGVNYTRSGYYLRKFMQSAVNYNVTPASNARRPWILFRYAEILLNYAEAVNELAGPDALPTASDAKAFPLTARAAINQVRARTGIAMPPIPIGLSKDAMRERIKNERRVELCFEGHRFYDVRRWKEGEKYLNKPVTGMRITKNANNTFNYQRFPIETRVFEEKNYRFPFSLTDINRQPALIQNKGY